MLIRTRTTEPVQSITIVNRLRRGTCEEADCPLYLHGQTFAVTLAPGHPAAHARTTQSYDPTTGIAVIHHPAGAACGPRCPNEYCPCAPAGGFPGAGGYPHRVQLELEPGYYEGTRPLVLSEAHDRLAGGVEAVRFRRTRGL